MIRDRSYSSAVKKYCDEVYAGLMVTYNNPEVRELCENMRQCSVPMEQ